MGIYDVKLDSGQEKIKHCIRFSNQVFKEDAENLYDILVQYLGTIGVGGNIIA